MIFYGGYQVESTLLTKGHAAGGPTLNQTRLQRLQWARRLWARGNVLSLPLLALMGLSARVDAQDQGLDTLVRGAIFLGEQVDGAVQVFLPNGQVIVLQPGTFRVSGTDIFVSAQTADAIDGIVVAKIAADASADSVDSLYEIPQFTSAPTAEVIKDQNFIINVDANVAGDASGLVYSIIDGPHSDDFFIDPLTGVVTRNPLSLNPENPVQLGSQEIIVRATTALGNFKEQTLIIDTVAVPSSNSFGSLSNQTLTWIGVGAGASILALGNNGSATSSDPVVQQGELTFTSNTATANLAENSPVNTVSAGYRAFAIDPNNKAITYRVVNVTDMTGLGLTVDDFSLNASGHIVYKGTAGLDLEAIMAGGAEGLLKLTIEASNGKDTDTQVVTLTITDVDEFDVTFVSAAPNSPIEIDENVIGDISGYFAEASDGDAKAHVEYKITGVAYKSSASDIPLNVGVRNVPDDIVISPAGVISVVKEGGLDFEQLEDDFVLTIEATSNNKSVTQEVEFSVVNRNEAPVFNPIRQHIVVDETSSGPLDSIIAIDPDKADTLTYSISSGNDSGIFEINSPNNVGVVTFADPSNEDNNGTYTLTITATDDNTAGDPDGFMSGTLTLTVTVNEIA